MDELRALRALAKAMGVHALHRWPGRRVVVAPETLLRVCRTLGAAVERPADAAEATRARRAAKRGVRITGPRGLGRCAVASYAARTSRPRGAASVGRRTVTLDAGSGELRAPRSLPPGYHQLTVEHGRRVENATVIAAPVRAWRRDGRPGAGASGPSWPRSAHRAAVRWATSEIWPRSAPGSVNEVATW